MSSSIQVISKDFFRECKSLSWAPLETGSQLSQLEVGAFSQSGLTSIHLPASLTVIGDRCFSGCGSLASITFESSSHLSQVAKEVFCDTGLTSIHLPASVTVIGESCFCACDSLASITFDCPSQLQEIHRDAFRGVAVEALILPGGIRHLSGSAFVETPLETLSFSALSIVEDISLFHRDLTGLSTQPPFSHAPRPHPFLTPPQALLSPLLPPGAHFLPAIALKSSSSSVPDPRSRT
jgi:hypothetical protein